MNRPRTPEHSRAAPAPDRVRRPAGANAGLARKTSKPDAAGRRFEIDRVVLLRIAFAAIVVAFLYLILRVAIVAFGGGATQEAKRIERMVDEATVSRRPPAAATREEPGKGAGDAGR